jgi:hypothetical protein
MTGAPAPVGKQAFQSPLARRLPRTRTSVHQRTIGLRLAPASVQGSTAAIASGFDALPHCCGAGGACLPRPAEAAASAAGNRDALGQYRAGPTANTVCQGSSPRLRVWRFRRLSGSGRQSGRRASLRLTILLELRRCRRISSRGHAVEPASRRVVMRRPGGPHLSRLGLDARRADPLQPRPGALAPSGVPLGRGGSNQCRSSVLRMGVWSRATGTTQCGAAPRSKIMHKPDQVHRDRLQRSNLPRSRMLSPGAQYCAGSRG